MNSSVNGLVTLYIAIFLLAGNGYFSKGIALDVFDITAYRSLLAAIVIFCFMQLMRQSFALKSSRHYWLLFGLAILLGVHWYAFFYSMRISTVALGMTVLFTYPIFTVFFERAFFKKPIRLYDMSIACMVLLGVWLMGAESNSNDANNLEGVLVGLFSAACFAARNVMQQRYLKSYPAHQMIFYQVLVIGILFTPLTYHSDTGFNLLAQPASEWVKLLVLGALFTALPHSLLAHSLRTISAKSVALIGCMQPVIASLFAFLLLSEQPSLQVMAGAIIVLMGAVFETLKPSRVT